MHGVIHIYYLHQSYFLNAKVQMTRAPTKSKYSQYLIENGHSKDNTLLKELASLPALLSWARVMPPCAILLSPMGYPFVWSTQVLNISPSSLCVLPLQSCHCVTSAFLDVTGIIFLTEAVQAGLSM